MTKKHQEGLALLTTSIVLLLVAMLAMAALRDSQRESTSGARSRAATRTIHAADAGVQLARAHLLESPPHLLPINVTLGGATIQSRTRSQTTPVQLDQVGLGDVPEGYSVNLGAAGATYLNRIYFGTIEVPIVKGDLFARGKFVTDPRTQLPSEATFLAVNTSYVYARTFGIKGNSI